MIGFFEDIRIGQQAALGSHTFTAEDIVRFASRYDPQPFHVDAEAARASFYGELIASGWHTASVCMRLWVGHLNARMEASHPAPGDRRPRFGPSPGLRELRWLRPVRAGDVLTFSTRVVDKVELRSRPQWGLVVSRFAGVNQEGQDTISFLGQSFVERRGSGQRA